ncbi:MAG: ABC transporter permease [Patescibacteria group bacterium]
MGIISHWELIKHLSMREIKARYKQSFFGLLWILLNPFFQMLIMSFVFSQVIRIENLSVPYPIYLFVGLLPWLFFSGSLSSTISSLVDNSSLIKKIYFPREVLILSTLIAKLVDFFIASIIFIGMMAYYQIDLSWYMLLFFPIMIVQILFTMGLSLILSVLNLLYRDVQFVFQLVLQLWFYLTPIIYSVEFFPPELRWIFSINPMSVFINAYRKVLLGGDVFNYTSISIGLILSIVLFVVGYLLFKRLEGVVADIV